MHFGLRCIEQGRSVMRDKKPIPFAADEHIRRLQKGFVETVREGAGNVLGAGDPGDFAFHVRAHRFNRDLDSPRVGKNPLPAFADFLPADQQVPARMHALNPVFLEPHGFHAREFERLESGVEALVRGENGGFG